MVVVRVVVIVCLFGAALVACSGAFPTSLSPPETRSAATVTPIAAPPVASTPSRAGPTSTSVATAQASGQSTSPPTSGTVLLVADQAGRVFRFPATNGTIAPTPSAPSPLLDSLINPSSLAIDDDYLYVGE